ncbi:MAG: NB-ARC domain-containing protein, partial [Steroidobacteraceae bacterium]
MPGGKSDESYTVVRGNYFLGPAIFNTGGGDQWNNAPASAVPRVRALVNLKAKPSGFVGRSEHVEELLSFLAPSQESGSAVLVSAIAGLAGVGKSALALYVAQCAVERQWYNGAVVFIDMRGFDRDPARRASAAEGAVAALRAFGLRDADLPTTPEGQIAAYRYALAHYAREGMRVLLVLDNVFSETQIEPLLPADPFHRVLATSRRTFANLGARIVRLDVLDEPTAALLVDRALRDARPADGRAVSEPDAIVRLVQLCGCLPLALKMAASRLIQVPRRTVASLVEELEDEYAQLEVLEYDPGDGQTLGVRAAFDLSYRYLAPGQAALFRALAVNPGPDVTLEAAAALIGEALSETRRRLEALESAHLITPDESGERWGMHDLVRRYAAELAGPTTSDWYLATRKRVVEFYLARSKEAFESLHGIGAERSDHGRFQDRRAAREWFEAHRKHLVAAVAATADTGEIESAVQLAENLETFLLRQRSLDDLRSLGELLVAAAKRCGDTRVEAVAFLSLGGVLAELRAYDESIAAYRRSLA